MNFLQLKVTLTGQDSEYLCEIWRRIIMVDKQLDLLKLHAILQGAMGWNDSHLHLFEINGKTYSIPDEDDMGEDEDFIDERDIFLGDVLSGVSNFSYMYDFGDRWQHLIEIEEEKVFCPERAKHFAKHFRLPTCIDGQGACPPEDCGGMFGYANILRALSDPNAKDHYDMLKWYGSIDPYVFSKIQATGNIIQFLANKDQN